MQSQQIQEHQYRQMFSVVETTGMSARQVQEYWTLVTVNTGYPGVRFIRKEVQLGDI
jgi:hypothetical protein